MSMKHGVKWRPHDPAGIDRLTDGANVHGIPLKPDPRAHLALAHGFGKRGWIGIGHAFFRLTWREQRAVLLHEELHLRRHHLAKRLAMLPLFWTRWGMALAVRQELDADAYAAHHGFGVDLLAVVKRYPSGHFYPALDKRIAHLEQRIAAAT